MRKFKWDRNQILMEISQLENLLKDNSTHRHEIIFSIRTYDTMLDMLKEYHDSIVKPKESGFAALGRKLGLSREKTDYSKEILIALKEKLEGLLLRYPEANQYCSYFQEVANAARNNVTHANSHYQSYPLSNNELFTLMCSFFKNLDSKLFDVFNATFNNETLTSNNIDIIDIRKMDDAKSSQSRCACFFDQYNRRPYISLIRRNTIKDIYNFAHEIMHGISKVMNPNSSDIPNLAQKITTEVSSLFIEFAMDDFLLNAQGVTPEEIATFRQQKLEHTERCAQFVYNALTIPELNGELPDDIKLCTTRFNLEIEIEYMLSFFIALDLYEQYKENKEKGLANLKKLILSDSDSIENILQSIGIDYHSYCSLDNYKQHIKEIKEQLEGSTLTKRHN